MKIVDLRSTLVTCNDRLIEISGEHIYYAEEKNMEGHQNLFLLAYNREEHSERVLADYRVTRPDYVMHYFPFEDHILVVMEDGGSEAWLLKLDKHTGKEQRLVQAHFAGSFVDCCALDADHVVLYAKASRRDASLFREYRRHTGFTQAACLYDLEKDCCWSIQDPRICAGARLLPFSGGGERKLLVTQPYGTEEEKRKAYRDRRWVGEHIEDRVWLCTVDEFTEAVEQERPAAPMVRILQSGTDGMVRFAGEDSDSLYFRALYFPTDDQHILSVSKHTGKKQDAAQLNLSPEEADARFLSDNGHFLKLTATENDKVHVKGILNSTIDATYSRELGELISCMDDRYLIFRDTMSDETDSIIFYSIYDIKTGKTQEFEGSCAIQENVLVLV